MGPPPAPEHRPRARPPAHACPWNEPTPRVAGAHMRRPVPWSWLPPHPSPDHPTTHQVLCASNDAHDRVDPIVVPEGVQPGERITFEGWVDGRQGRCRGFPRRRRRSGRACRFKPRAAPRQARLGPRPPRQRRRLRRSLSSRRRRRGVSAVRGSHASPVCCKHRYTNEPEAQLNPRKKQFEKIAPHLVVSAGALLLGGVGSCPGLLHAQKGRGRWTPRPLPWQGSFRGHAGLAGSSSAGPHAGPPVRPGHKKPVARLLSDMQMACASTRTSRSRPARASSPAPFPARILHDPAAARPSSGGPCMRPPGFGSWCSRACRAVKKGAGIGLWQAPTERRVGGEHGRARRCGPAAVSPPGQP